MIMLYFSTPRWKQPRKVNGILERYMLYISNHLHDFTVWDVVYNSTELFEGHRLQHLLPGTKYLIKLGVSSLCLYRFPCPLLLLFVPSSLPPSKKTKQNPKLMYCCYSHWKLTSHPECEWCWSNTYVYFILCKNDSIPIWVSRLSQI